MKKNNRLQLLLVICFLLTLCSFTKTEAATKKYGLVIADQDGKYTFYDLNSTTKKAGIETNDSGKIMVPLKRLTELMPHVTYTYNAKTKKATIKNSFNGRKVVFTTNSKTFYYYSSAKAKAVKKTMSYNMYVSKISSAGMVYGDALKWVMGKYEGYHYYQVADMQKAGYDTYLYSGLIVYNPYKKVTEIPIATNVTGITSTVKVTIPEGYSVAQTFDLLVKKGVCASTDSLYKTLNEYDFDYYPLVKEVSDKINSATESEEDINEFRAFRLEGYLFPDTYEFYRLSKAENVIGKFLRNAESKITPEDREKAAALGYTTDEIITIASLIEKEADVKNMATVSSVIHNRLKIPMKLQLDATVFYVERYIKPYISGDINRFNSYYNTRKCSALPAGPICNPGKKAIQAALNPDSTDYLYFYSDKEGKYYFTVTYQEMLKIYDETANSEDDSIVIE